MPKSTIRHTYILRWLQTGAVPHIVTVGDEEHPLLDRKYTPLTEAKLDKSHLPIVMDQMASSVYICHAKGVIHRNLRPDVWLVSTDPDVDVVLSKFDNAILNPKTRNGEKPAGLYNVPSWGPECPDFRDSKDKASYGPEYDMWCLGLSMLQLSYPCVKIPKCPNSESWLQWLDGVLADNIGIKHEMTYKIIIRQLLQFDSGQRLTAYAVRAMCDVGRADLKEERVDTISSTFARHQKRAHTLECIAVFARDWLAIASTDFERFVSNVSVPYKDYKAPDENDLADIDKKRTIVDRMLIHILASSSWRSRGKNDACTSIQRVFASLYVVQCQLSDDEPDVMRHFKLANFKGPIEMYIRKFMLHQKDYK